MNKRKGGWEDGWIDGEIDERMSRWLGCQIVRKRKSGPLCQTSTVPC